MVVTQTSYRRALAGCDPFLPLDVAALPAAVSFDRETVSEERGGAAAPSSQVSALEGPRRPCRHGSEIRAVRLHFEVRFRGLYQCARVAIRSDILKPDVLVVAGRTHSQGVFGRVDRTSSAGRIVSQCHPSYEPPFGGSAFVRILQCVKAAKCDRSCCLIKERYCVGEIKKRLIRAETNL